MIELTYNPASQIVQLTRANAAFAWVSPPDFTYACEVNGLNHYTSVGGQAFAYDLHCNLTNDATRTYTYDMLNRLTSSGNGAA